MLTHGSLFAGIGGFDLGFERAGFKTIWQVELDDYATKVLEKHWPNVPRFRDIRLIDWRTVPIPTVLTGGFPCQDISNAGKRAGLAGSRSGLWVEFRRAIVSLRPRYVVVENVAALYQRGLDRVLGDLAESGYDAEWDCLPAAAIGAPHLRERIFIVAYPNCRGLSESDICQEQPRGTQTVSPSEAVADARLQRPAQHEVQTNRPEQCGQNVAHSDGNSTPCVSQEIQTRKSDACQHGYLAGGSEKIRSSDYWTTEPDVGRVAHGVPHRVDRLKCLGNAVVPQIAEQIAWAIRKSIKR